MSIVKQPVVELQSHDADGTIETLYFAQSGYLTPSDVTPTDQLIDGRLKSGIQISWRVQSVTWGQPSSTATTIGVVDLNNVDGALDYLINRTTRDLDLRVYDAAGDEDLDEITLIAENTLEQVTPIDDETMRIVSVDKSARLERSVQLAVFDQTINQTNANLDGQSRPWVMGKPLHCDAVIIDESSLIYEVNVDGLDSFDDVQADGDQLVGGGTDYNADLEVGQFELLANPGNTEITASVTRDPIPDEVLGVTDFTAGTGAFEQWSDGLPKAWLFRVQGSLSGGESSTEISDYGSGLGMRVDVDNDDEKFELWLIGLFERGGHYQVTLDVGTISSYGTNLQLTISQFDQAIFDDDSTHTITSSSGSFSFDVTATGPDLVIRRETFNVQGSFWINNLVVREVHPAEAFTLPGAFRHLAELAGFRDAELRFGGARQAAVDVSYTLGLAFGVDSGSSILQALQGVAASVAGWVYVHGDGSLRFGQLQPATANPIATITDNDLQGDILIELDRAPGLTTRIGADWNFVPLTNVVGSVGIEDADALKSDFLSIVEADDIEQLSHEYIHAKTAEIRQTYLRDLDDAPLAEINRQIGLYAPPRFFYIVPGVLSDTSRIKAGDTVRLQSDRYGLDYGTDLVAVGSTSNQSDQVSDLVLWGTAGRYRIRCGELLSNTGIDGNYAGDYPDDGVEFTFCTCFQAADFDASSSTFEYFSWSPFSGSGLGLAVRVIGGGGSTDAVLHITGRGPSGLVLELKASFTAQGGYNSTDPTVWNSLLLAVHKTDGHLIGYLNNRQIKWDVTETNLVGDLYFSIGSPGFRATNQTTPSTPFCHTGFHDQYLEIRDPSIRRRFFDIYNRPATDDVTLMFGAQPWLFVTSSHVGESLGVLPVLVNHASTDFGPFIGYSPTDDSILSGWKRYQPAAMSFAGTGTGGAYQQTSVTLSDSPRGSLAIWFKSASADVSGTYFDIYVGANHRLRVYEFFYNVYIIGYNASNTVVLSMRIPLGGAGTQNALLASWDLERDLAGMWLNDSPENFTLTTLTTDETLDLSGATTARIGSDIDSNYYHGGLISQAGLTFDEYIDFSLEVNRRRFFDKYGRPVFGGRNGEIAFGHVPAIWIADGDGTLNTGTLGEFSVEGSPSPVLADTYPAD